MKKLFVAGALTAIATAAAAQSSVTLTGVVDLGVQHVRGSGTSSATFLSDGGLATSRLVFRGQEDLGGGLYAGFWLEGGINADSGIGKANNTNNQPSGALAASGFVFDRMSYVRLGGRWGEVKLGKDYIQTHWVNVLFDPFNANGVGKDLNFTIAAVTTGPLPTAVVATNLVSYSLPPNLGGFYGHVQVGLGENLSSAPNSRDGDFRSARVGYSQGPLQAAVAYSHTNYLSTATIGDYSHADAGLSYDFGFARIMGLYGRVRVQLAAGEVRKNTALIGAIVPVTRNTRLRASYMRLQDQSSGTLRNANGTAQSTNDAHQLAFGFIHDLSARTAFYGTVSQIQNAGAGTYAVAGPAPAPGRSSTGMELGFRHIF